MTLRPRLATGLPFSPWHSGLGGLSVFPALELDRTCVHELEVKIQVVQLRRIVLLFALVLGLVAVVTALSSPPESREEGEPAPPPADSPPAAAPRAIRLSAPAARGKAPVRRVATDTRVALEVRVDRPGDVELQGLGLRQTATPLAPARFELLARPAGRHDLLFHPVRGEQSLAGRLVFEERASVKLR